MTDVTVIGCGEHGKTVLLPALHAAGARIVGLHDADAGRAAAAARRWGIPRLLGSIDETIDAGEAIVCALPGPAHFDIVDRALTRGRFVFVEKPPAVTLHEVEALIATERCSTRAVQSASTSASRPACRNCFASCRVVSTGVRSTSGCRSSLAVLSARCGASRC